MSTKQDVVERYMEGFRRSDHAMILGCLTDDVVWDLPGFRFLEGKQAFDGEIENPDFSGSPTLVVERTIEDGNAVVVTGKGEGHLADGRTHRFAFADLFVFRGDLIERVESYVVPLGS